MAKNTYYVSVGSRTVQDTIPDTEYMAVLADDAELARLQELLGKQETIDEASHVVAPIPYKSNDHAAPSQAYDENLINLYGYLFQIGTEETRAFIEGMGIRERLRDTDYNYPGYKR